MSDNKAMVTRRHFLEATTLSAAGLMLNASSSAASALGANDRVNIGVVGAGGQGTTLIRNMATVPNSKITAMCDICLLYTSPSPRDS